jgi:hypothetical protein
LKCAKCFVDTQKQAPKIYQHATIFGLRFSGRGVSGREMSEAISDVGQSYGKEIGQLKYRVSNQNNSLKDGWYNKKEYSSWCKFRAPVTTRQAAKSTRNVTKLNCNYFYAQLNYMFYLNLPADEILHGVPFANIVPRQHKSEASNLVDVIQCHDDWSSYVKDPHIFTALTNAFATPILLQPTTLAGVPVCTVKTARKCTVDSQKYITQVAGDVGLFYMLPLYPMNDCIVYDKTKNHLYNLKF